MVKEKLKKLDDLEALWRKCEACPLSVQRAKVVMWRGSPAGRIFMIGEAPGADEDEQGIPFVGRAGRRLDVLMKAARISADDVFIANMVGCRPPGNRRPEAEELKACRRRLEAMLWIVQPSVVVLLGATAARLAGINTISQWRGQPTSLELCLYNGEVREWPALPTYHPSFLLRARERAGEIKQEMVSDLKKARRMAYGRKRAEETKEVGKTSGEGEGERGRA